MCYTISMLVVILGAGASYDSDPGDPPPSGVLQVVAGHGMERPPLAAQLFLPRFGRFVDRYPQSRALVGKLRAIGTSSTIEKELEKIRDDALRYPHLPRMLTAIRFYLRDLVSEITRKWSAASNGVTNHVGLLYELEPWRHDNAEKVCFITFNYDLLIEEALETVFGIKFESMSSYISSDHYTAVKLHGSVDWFREVLAPDKPNPLLTEQHVDDDHFLIEAGGSLRLGDAILARGERNSFPHNQGVALFHPALAIPTVTKTDFECPPSHVEHALAALKAADRILVVGWRGQEEHFTRRWNATGGASSMIQVVDGSLDGANAARDNLQATLGSRGMRYLANCDEGFSRFLAQGQLAELLR